MRRRLAHLLVSAAVLLLAGFRPGLAQGQEINFGAVSRSKPNLIQVRGGAEYAFVAGVGYARSLPIGTRALVIGADYLMPVSHPGFSDYRVRLLGQVTIIGSAHWKLVGRLAPTVRGLDHEWVRMTNVGLDTGLVGGRYAKRWFVAGEIGFDWALTTHLRHTDQFRDSRYADVKDGWYANAGGNFYYGLFGGYSFEPVDLILRVGQARDWRFRGQLLPFYATVGVNIRFGDARWREKTPPRANVE